VVARVGRQPHARERAPVGKHRRRRGPVRHHRREQLRPAAQPAGRVDGAEAAGLLAAGAGGGARGRAHGVPQGTLRVPRLPHPARRGPLPSLLRRPPPRLRLRGGGAPGSQLPRPRVPAAGQVPPQVLVPPSPRPRGRPGAHPVVLRDGEQLHGRGLRWLRLAGGVAPRHCTMPEYPPRRPGPAGAGEDLRARAALPLSD